MAVTFPVSYQTYIEGPMTITATASDPDGTIARVVFYVDEDSVGQDLSSPYSFTHYMHPKPGEGAKWYAKARAYDNGGLYTEENIAFFITPNSCSLLYPETSRQIICAGDSVHIGTEASAGGKAVQWYRQTGEDTWAIIENDTIHSYYARQTGNYRAVWTYTNLATCTTAVDSVSTLQIELPPVYTYGGLPSLATAHASGGAEPYSFVWSSYDSCLNANCDSVMISDFSGPVVLTVTDQLSCMVSDTVIVNYLSSRLCGAQEPDSSFNATPYTEGQVGSMFNSKESEFQNYINEIKALDKVPGWEYDEVLVPIVFYVFYPPLSMPNTRKVNDSAVVKQLEEINNRFQGQEFKLNGKPTRFRFCLATTYLDSNQQRKPVVEAIYLPNNDQTRLKIKSSTSGIVYIIDSTANLRYYNNPYGYKAATRTHVLSRFSSLDARRYVRVFVPNVYSNYPGATYAAISLFLKEQYYVEDETDATLRTRYFSDLNPTFIRRLNHNHFQRYDGVFVRQTLIGSSSYTPYPTDYYRLGRKTIHELGHFLGLWHPSTPAEYPYPVTNPFVCQDSLFYLSEYPMADFVADTPPQKKFTNSVLTFWGMNINNCDTIRLNKLSDSTSCGGFSRPLRNNPMDYVSDACQDTFTTGQVERMVYGASFYRPELISPENAAMAGIQCRPSPGFYLRKDFYCSEADSTQFTVYLAKGGTLTSDSIRLNLSSNQYKVVSQNSDSARIRLYPPTGIPPSFVVTRKIHFSGEPTGGMAYSKPIYFFSGPCSVADAAKSLLIFGQYAALAAGANGQYEPNTAVHNSKPDSTRIYAYGGSVTYNHPQTGNLLFYSAGKHLWNKNHKRLTTYNSVLMGSDSSAQYGIALPHPTDTNLVSLFTVPSNEESSLGFRMHNIRLANINHASTPTLNGSYLNKAITIPTKHPIQRGNNSAIKVADKITVVPKACAASGYWIIVQGHYTDANYKNKFLIFSFDAADTIPRFVDSCYAGGWAKNGVLKASPDGFSL
ncbi:MAG TPA: Ig-like domain-containing protein, partial [Catalimonadaceae bacterium]|nr:Ig-like domain-containing protein [Catalimonadaceae bacterium]